MNCPGCGHRTSDVLETRTMDQERIERRRQCTECQARWTTDEYYRRGSFSTPTGRGATTTTDRGSTTATGSGSDLSTPTGRGGFSSGGVGGALSPDSVSGPGPDVRTLSQQSERSLNVMGPRRRRKKVPYTADFLAFWAAYPRKVKKPLAAIAWLDEKPELAEVLAALAWQCLTPEWRKEGGQFVPHPATYINQRRWEDEADSTPILTAKEALNHQAGRNVLERVKQLGFGSGK